MPNYTLLANAIRMLTADAVEKAKSGHPGMPMGMAEIAAVLWTKHLKHNPQNPQFANRDRFILSNGHGSMLIYALLHLSGYDLSLEDIKNFRQLGSKTPGHPEYGHTVGIETTTGPLGQGLANAVGMALSEKILAQEFNRSSHIIIDHYTYVFVGDGCLMEGISHEVCSLAGTWGLGKLIVLYDHNGISIDGKVEQWFSEDIATRFQSYNWQVIGEIDGHNAQAVDEAIQEAKSETARPSLIICKTIIGHGAPSKANTEEVHGSPLGSEEIELLRQQLDWHYPPFVIPTEIYKQFDCTSSGKEYEQSWHQVVNEYELLYPQLMKEYKRRINHQLPINFKQIIADAVSITNEKRESIASRKSSLNAIEYYAKYLPELVGGSADLTASNLTRWKLACPSTSTNYFTGNYISYGVREFGMSAILNGMYLHGGVKPFGGTFLTFSDYARNAVRMASLMRIAPIFVYTHDSIGLGEDGPTHQPIEHIASLRLIPNLDVWRPCDTVETIVAWGCALSQSNTPSCLVLSRQNLQFITRSSKCLDNIYKGGYILAQSDIDTQIVIIATGSEVQLALAVYNILLETNKKVQLVSMPSTFVFDKQDSDYKETVIPSKAKKIAIEAGVSDLWYKYVGLDGLVIGLDNFGESAPAKDLFEHFGFSSGKIAAKIKDYLNISM